MTRIEKCELAISRGFKYDPITGNVFGVKGGVIGKKCNGYIALTLFYKGKRNYLFAHQFAWYVMYGETVELIDHKNRIKTDNSIRNLRSFTKQLNAYNMNSRGTCLDKRTGRWESIITVNGKSKYLGKFDSEEMAHERYLEYKNKLIA